MARLRQLDLEKCRACGAVASVELVEANEWGMEASSGGYYCNVCAQPQLEARERYEAVRLSPLLLDTEKAPLE